MLWLWLLFIGLVLVIFLLLFKIRLLRRTAEELFSYTVAAASLL